MSTSDNCIVSLGIGLSYGQALDDLNKKCQDFQVQADLLFFKEYPEGCPSHEKIPYAFKYYLLQYCLKLGYKRVLYLDSSVQPTNNLYEVWNWLDKYGYLFITNRHSIGEYCHDQALNKFCLDRTATLSLPSLQGGFIGLNATFPSAVIWLNKMNEISTDKVSFVGSFKNQNNLCSNDPKVKGHRHDQTIGSIVANNLNMTNWWPYDQKTFHVNYQKTYCTRTEMLDHKNSFWWAQLDMRSTKDMNLTIKNLPLSVIDNGD